MILGGRLAPGERLSETDMVELLGVSRTPARMAMMRLYDEGLVEEIASSGGFRVRSFSADEVFAAVEIRGLLESLAARLAAERRPVARDLDALRVCVAEMDDVVHLSHAHAQGIEIACDWATLCRQAGSETFEQAADLDRRENLIRTEAPNSEPARRRNLLN